jgi:hypothetical protein
MALKSAFKHCVRRIRFYRDQIAGERRPAGWGADRAVQLPSGAWLSRPWLVELMPELLEPEPPISETLRTYQQRARSRQLMWFGLMMGGERGADRAAQHRGDSRLRFALPFCHPLDGWDDRIRDANAACSAVVSGRFSRASEGPALGASPTCSPFGTGLDR